VSLPIAPKKSPVAKKRINVERISRQSSKGRRHSCARTNHESGDYLEEIYEYLRETDERFLVMLKGAGATLGDNKLITIKAIKMHLRSNANMIALLRSDAASNAHSTNKYRQSSATDVLYSATDDFVITATNVRNRILRDFSNDVAAKPRFERLSLRESEVFAYIVGGYSNKIIAYRMNIETSTVKAHVTNMLRKLGVHSRIRAVALFGHNVLPQ
jgi:DNA-binding NarL/FixJ family response regulator